MKRCIFRSAAVLLAALFLFLAFVPARALSIVNPSSKSNYGLPQYWLSYLEKKQKSIDRADINLGFYGVSFAFITDVHVKHNAMRSPGILAYLNDHTGIHKVVCGGDLVHSRCTREEALDQLIRWRNATSSLNIVNILGNHDLNSNNQTDVSAILPVSAFYALACRPSESHVSWEKGCLYGYEDDLSQQVRYIYLDTKDPARGRIDPQQIAWMKEKILSLEKGWTVVLFAHRFFKERETLQSDPLISTHGATIQKALDEIYDEAKAVIACVITGHIHRDYVFHSDKGYPVIVTSCDSYKKARQRDLIKHQLGTTSEQCFDLFYINTKKRTIQTIRIGAGDQAADRFLTY